MSEPHCNPVACEITPPKTLRKLRYHVFVCSDAGDFCGCEAAGGAALLGALRQELASRRLMAYVKVTLMNCNQPGASGPVMVVYPDALWYAGLTAEHAGEFVERQLVRGEPLREFLSSAEPRATATL